MKQPRRVRPWEQTDEPLTIPPRAAASSFDRARFVYMPRRNDHEIVLEAPPIDDDPEALPLRGYLRAYGTSMYEFHLEVPISYQGVPIADAEVLELDDRGSILRTPYRAWCREHGLVVECGRCREEILPTSNEQWCPERLRRMGHHR